MLRTDPIRYRYNKIINFNKRYLQEHNEYVESKLNLREKQEITLI